MVPTEAQIQTSFFDWINMFCKELRPFIFHVPNGGYRCMKTAISLKKQGVLPGVADVFLMIPNSERHGLWIEFKRDKSAQSSEQKEFEEHALSQGYEYKIARSIDNAIRIVEEYLKEKKL
jgi:hypothetical protein